jgi:hypothetical protein
MTWLERCFEQADRFERRTWPRRYARRNWPRSSVSAIASGFFSLLATVHPGLYLVIPAVVGSVVTIQVSLPHDHAALWAVLYCALAAPLWPVAVASAVAAPVTVLAIREGVREARPVVLGAFIAATIAAGCLVDLWFALGHLSITVVVMLVLYGCLRRQLVTGRPPLVSAVYRWAGNFTGATVALLAYQAWLMAPLNGWLRRPDPAAGDAADAAARTLLAEAGLADRTDPADLQQLVEAIRKRDAGLPAFTDPAVGAVLVRYQPRFLTEHALGLLAQAGALVALGVALLTLAPLVASLLRRGAAGTAVRCRTTEICGRVVRWELTVEGWRALLAPRRPGNASAAAAGWPAGPAAPHWVSAADLAGKVPRPAGQVTDLLSGVARGVTMLAAAVAVGCAAGLGLTVVKVYLSLRYWAGHLDEVAGAGTLSAADRLKLQADMIAGSAQVWRGGIALLVALAGFLATAVIGAVALRDRLEPIAADVVVGWCGRGVDRTVTAGTVDRIRYTRHGWHARVRGWRRRAVLGWFPLSSLRPPDTDPASWWSWNHPTPPHGLATLRMAGPRRTAGPIACRAWGAAPAAVLPQPAPDDLTNTCSNRSGNSSSPSTTP